MKILRNISVVFLMLGTINGILAGTVNIYLENKTLSAITATSKGQSITIASGKKEKVDSLPRVPVNPKNKNLPISQWQDADARIEILLSIGCYLVAYTQSYFDKNDRTLAKGTIGWMIMDGNGVRIGNVNEKCSTKAELVKCGGYTISSVCKGFDIIAAPDIVFTITE